MTEWIKCSDRKPKVRELCVYWIKKPNMRIQDGFPEATRYFEGFYREDSFGEITHWMPLPPPPKD